MTDLFQQTDVNYDPNNLINSIMTILNLKSDAALARRLAIAPPVICKIRSFNLGVGPSLLINLHEETGLSIKDLRKLMGDQRNSAFRIIKPQPNVSLKTIL